MKRTIIVNIPMTINAKKSVYVSNDKSLPASEKAFTYPVLSYLEKTLTKDDEIRFVLIVQKSDVSKYEYFLEVFKGEMKEINYFEIPVEYVVISSEFEETRYVHEALMGQIINNVEDGSNLIADITFGSKDVPIVEFAALNFLVDHLSCKLEHILYGQALFGENNEVLNTKLCDLAPLFSLSSLTSSLQNISGDKARNMLGTLISLPEKN